MSRLHFKGGPWTNKEDEVLKSAIAQYGMHHWDKVASLLTNKTAAQCQERWEKYLHPSLIMPRASASAGAGKGGASAAAAGTLADTWTAAEDALLAELHQMFPFQWQKISSEITRQNEAALRKNGHSPATTPFMRADWMCEERFHELQAELEYYRKKQQQQQQQQQEAGRGEAGGGSGGGSGGGGGGGAGSHQTLAEYLAHARRQRLRLNPEVMPAKDDEKVNFQNSDMLEMAVSRLANQDQKKGMRRDREARLSDAKFLAKLENSRENRETGVLSVKEQKRLERALAEDRSTRRGGGAGGGEEAGGWRGDNDDADDDGSGRDDMSGDDDGDEEKEEMGSGKSRGGRKRARGEAFAPVDMAELEVAAGTARKKRKLFLHTEEERARRRQERRLRGSDSDQEDDDDNEERHKELAGSVHHKQPQARDPALQRLEDREKAVVAGGIERGLLQQLASASASASPLSAAPVGSSSTTSSGSAIGGLERAKLTGVNNLNDNNSATNNNCNRLSEGMSEEEKKRMRLLAVLGPLDDEEEEEEAEGYNTARNNNKNSNDSDKRGSVQAEHVSNDFKSTLQSHNNDSITSSSDAILGDLFSHLNATAAAEGKSGDTPTVAVASALKQQGDEKEVWSDLFGSLPAVVSGAEKPAGKRENKSAADLKKLPSEAEHSEHNNNSNNNNSHVFGDLFSSLPPVTAVPSTTMPSAAAVDTQVKSADFGVSSDASPRVGTHRREATETDKDESEDSPHAGRERVKHSEAQGVDTQWARAAAAEDRSRRPFRKALQLVAQEVRRHYFFDAEHHDDNSNNNSDRDSDKDATTTTATSTSATTTTTTTATAAHVAAALQNKRHLSQAEKSAPSSAAAATPRTNYTQAKNKEEENEEDLYFIRAQHLVEETARLIFGETFISHKDTSERVDAHARDTTTASKKGDIPDSASTDTLLSPLSACAHNTESVPSVEYFNALASLRGAAAAARAADAAAQCAVLVPLARAAATCFTPFLTPSSSSSLSSRSCCGGGGGGADVFSAAARLPSAAAAATTTTGCRNNNGNNNMRNSASTEAVPHSHPAADTTLTALTAEATEAQETETSELPSSSLLLATATPPPPLQQPAASAGPRPPLSHQETQSVIASVSEKLARLTTLEGRRRGHYPSASGGGEDNVVTSACLSSSSFVTSAHPNAGGDLHQSKCSNAGAAAVTPAAAAAPGGDVIINDAKPEDAFTAESAAAATGAHAAEGEESRGSDIPSGETASQNHQHTKQQEQKQRLQEEENEEDTEEEEKTMEEEVEMLQLAQDILSELHRYWSAQTRAAAEARAAALAAWEGERAAALAEEARLRHRTESLRAREDELQQQYRELRRAAN